jgi:hypothetical protein
MDKPMRVASAGLGLGVSFLLAACGGRLDDAASPAAERPPQGAAQPAHAAPLASTAPAALADELPQLRQQIEVLRREVASLRAQVARIPGAVRVAEPEVAHPQVDAQSRAEAEREDRLRLAAAEQAFRSEQRDPRWSQGATATVRAALGELDDTLRNQVRSVECRAQSCRVEIGADSSGQLMQDLPLMLSRLGSTLPHATAAQVDQGDGRQATVLYLSR